MKRILPCAVLTGDIVASTAPSRGPEAPADLLKGVAACVQVAFPEAFPQPFSFDVFSGDSWQLVVCTPEHSIRISLLIRALLKGLRDLDTRVAIALGHLERPPTSRPGEAMDEVYIASGRSLSSMAPSRRTILAVSTDDGELAPTVAVNLMNEVLRLVDAISSDWTAKQALAVAGSLRGWDPLFIGMQWDPERRDRYPVEWQIALTLAQSHPDGKPRSAARAVEAHGLVPHRAGVISRLLATVDDAQSISRSAVSQHLSAAHWPPIQKAVDAVETALGEVGILCNEQ